MIAEQAELHFDGATYDPEQDHDRLTTQLDLVRFVLRDGEWHTIRELALRAKGSESGVSARIRDLRKARFGGYSILKRRVSGGLWEYRMQL